MGSLHTRSRFIGNFEVISKLGSGSFATVYKAKCVTPSSKWRDIRLGEYVAVKLINPGINKDVESAEILAASIVPINDGLMRIYGADWDPNTGQLYTVCELLDGSDLFEACFKESDVRTIMKIAVYAVKALHERNIIHRDIKPDNFIRVDKNSLVAKLGDFGLIHQLKYGHPRHTAGTDSFMAPEQMYSVAIDYGMKISAEKRGKIVKGSKKADVWSLGITAMELLTGRDAFPEKYDPNYYYKAVILRDFNTPISRLPIGDKGKEWLYGMLDEDPDKRFTIQEACSHPWIQGNSIQYVNRTMTQPMTAPHVSQAQPVYYRPAEQQIGVQPPPPPPRANRAPRAVTNFHKQATLPVRTKLPVAPDPPNPLRSRPPVASRRPPITRRPTSVDAPPPITRRPTLNEARPLKLKSRIGHASQLYDDIRGQEYSHAPLHDYGDAQLITNTIRNGKHRAPTQTITRTHTIRAPQDHREPVYEPRYDNRERVDRKSYAAINLPRRKGESRWNFGGTRRDKGGYGDKDPFY